jgi:hypothetical protein
MKILGFSERIRFQKGDIFRSDYSKRKFDLFVSNLVFHNFGRKRFNAYERLAQWAIPKSYIALGDLFFDYKKDSKLLTTLFGSVQVRPGPIIDRAYKVLSEPSRMDSIEDFSRYRRSMTSYAKSFILSYACRMVS